MSNVSHISTTRNAVDNWSLDQFRHVYTSPNGVHTLPKPLDSARRGIIDSTRYIRCTVQLLYNIIEDAVATNKTLRVSEISEYKYIQVFANSKICQLFGFHKKRIAHFLKVLQLIFPYHCKAVTATSSKIWRSWRRSYTNDRVAIACQCQNRSRRPGVPKYH